MGHQHNHSGHSGHSGPHGHHHHHGHHHGMDGAIQGLQWAFVLNLCFTIIEIIGAYFTNSVSILADSLHDLGDSVGLLLAWAMQKLSAKTKDESFSYGYTRLSMLAAVINSVILVIGSLGMVAWAVHRLMNPELVEAKGMIGLSVLGVLVNGFAAWRLYRGGTLNEQMAFWHLLEDALGWVAVFIGGVAIAIWEIHWLDPLLCIGISIFIGWNVIRRFKEALRVLLQAVPEGLSIQQVQKVLLDFPEVRDVHHVQLWSLDGATHVGTAHVVVSAEFSKSQMIDLKQRAKIKLLAMRIEWLTLEFEFQDEFCAEADPTVKTDQRGLE